LLLKEPLEELLEVLLKERYEEPPKERVCPERY
jgi:hypothetical protein